MTFSEVNTRIYQPMEHDIHRGRVEYHVSWVDRVMLCHRLIRCVLTNYFRYRIKLIMAVIGQTGVSGEQCRRFATVNSNLIVHHL
jgi:hypothetical protein